MQRIDELLDRLRREGLPVRGFKPDHRATEAEYLIALEITRLFDNYPPSDSPRSRAMRAFLRWSKEELEAGRIVLPNDEQLHA